MAAIPDGPLPPGPWMEPTLPEDGADDEGWPVPYVQPKRADSGLPLRLVLENE